MLDCLTHQEIPETVVITHLTYTNSFIEAMHQTGCSFAPTTLVVSGNELSLFVDLKYLPVDYLKIDGVFDKGIAENQSTVPWSDQYKKLLAVRLKKRANIC